MLAIISDVHGNLEALRAVLDDADRHGATDVYCLGDVVGYGPNPRECIDLVMQCRVVLLGNHDQGAMFDPDGFNGPAEPRLREYRGDDAALYPGWSKDLDPSWSMTNLPPATMNVTGSVLETENSKLSITLVSQ